jgi:hypothetical protein
MTLSRRIIAVSLAFILLNSTTALACGPFALEAIFVHIAHPTYPLAQFAAGRIGVVQPSYARSYLYVAYRYLSGSNFSPSEQKALVDLWKQRLDLGSDGDVTEWSKAWLEERKKIPGVQDRGDIDVYRPRDKPNEYESYVNCNRDSFETAVKTLADRTLEYKSETSLLLDWVNAQDQVFSNCSSGSSIPEPLPSSARLLARQDRDYQIAAAQFYAANFDEAKTRFEQIAADDKSPWHFVAAYMVARTLIRKASLGAPEQKQEPLQAAETQLTKILANKRFAQHHASATRLANLVRLRLHPEQRLHELARILTTNKQNDNLKQDLWDYTTLLDQYLDLDETAPTPAVVKGDDLSEWLASMEEGDENAPARAVERWRATHSDPWLIAALGQAEGTHPTAAELIAAAMKIQPNSPAFVSARFHAARLMMESGKNNEARAQLDDLLKNHRAKFDESTFNLLSNKRMMLATTFEDFLVYVPRTPAALSWNDDGREIPADDETVSTEMKDLKGQARFDHAAAEAINQQIPLAMLKQAASNRNLTGPLRRDIAQAVWLRASIIGDTKTADEAVPALKALVPELTALLDEYVSATTPQTKQSVAIYAWLKFPGLEPVVDEGVGRRTPLNQQDEYRDNWWCGAAFQPVDEEENREVLAFTPATAQPPLFLTAAQRANADRERKALAAVGAAPNYIAEQVIKWANASPADPRVPEALHLAVTTTRFGCTDKNTGRWSKAAFDLLHRKYPNTSWAKKTKYWFKD